MSHVTVSTLTCLNQHVKSVASARLSTILLVWTVITIFIISIILQPPPPSAFAGRSFSFHTYMAVRSGGGGKEGNKNNFKTKGFAENSYKLFSKSEMDSTERVDLAPTTRELWSKYG